MSTQSASQQAPPPPPPPLMNNLRVNSTSAALIRPTNAGLLPQHGPSASTLSYDQQVPTSSGHSVAPSSSPLSSAAFKNELMAKQSRFSSLSPSPNGPSIDDRIKSRKEASHLVNQQQLAPSNGVPEKLLSTMQKDKRPFAYSPDVNDPNNKAKLDLTQIKSPIMRRRLLANMESSEDRESDDDDDADQQTTVNVNTEHNQIESQPVTLARHSSPIFEDTRTIPANDYRQHSQLPGPPRIKYNEAPRFYNNNNLTDLNQEPRYLDDLGAQVAESLESLSLLVNNLDTRNQSNSTTTCKLRTPSSYLRDEPGNRQPAQLSTFSSTGNSKGQATRQTSPLETRGNFSTSSTRTTASAANSALPITTMGTYFGAEPSNFGPYTISPYYGSSLDVESCEFPSGQAQVEYNNNNNIMRYYQAPHNRAWTSSPRTFSSSSTSSSSTFRHNRAGPPPDYQYSSRVQPTHNFVSYSANSTTTPVGSTNNEHLEQVRALRQMTAKLQSEVDRLHGLAIKRL